MLFKRSFHEDWLDIMPWNRALVTFVPPAPFKLIEPSLYVKAVNKQQTSLKIMAGSPWEIIKSNLLNGIMWIFLRAENSFLWRLDQGEEPAYRFVEHWNLWIHRTSLWWSLWYCQKDPILPRYDGGLLESKRKLLWVLTCKEIHLPSSSTKDLIVDIDPFFWIISLASSLASMETGQKSLRANLP